jgi:hypothetical protein
VVAAVPEAPPAPDRDDRETLAARFARDGFVSLTPTLPAEFHRAIWERLFAASSSGRREFLGNNMLAALPELDTLLRDPPVDAALRTVVGDDYLLHPHRAAHLNAKDALRDPWHKETRGGRDYTLRQHRPWWAALFYYPQQTTAEMGPTALLPGSQTLDELPPGVDDARVSNVGAAGNCVLIHYDLWHRRQPGAGEPPRFLVKFEFVRTSPPSPAAAPAVAGAALALLAEHLPPAPGPIVPLHHAAWLSGTRLGPAQIPALPDATSSIVTGDPVERARAASAHAFQDLEPASHAVLANAVHDEYASVGLSAAYSLSTTERGCEELLSLFRTAPPGPSRRAGHALVECAAEVAGRLLDCPASDSEIVRQMSARILAESGMAEADRVLDRLSSDPSPRVRAAAVEGLSRREGDLPVGVLARCVDDESYDVRLEATIGLCRLGPQAAAALPTLQRLTSCGDRYLEAFAFEALVRVDSAGSLRDAARRLLASRWCPHSTPASPW